MGAPFFSIITASFDAASTIRQTLESVRDQSFRDFEHVVIDGGSTDGTVDILREFDLTYWHSEPDGGIADAMNKGVEKVTGKYVLFLHADDYLPDLAALQRCADNLDGAPTSPSSTLCLRPAARASGDRRHIRSGG